MLRLAGLLYSIVATALAGTGVIAALTLGYVSWQPMLIAAVIGAVIAVPVSGMIAKAILAQE